MFNIGLDRENMEKIFLTETTRQIALIFGMKHHLVDFYQIYSKNAPGSKTDLVTRVMEAYIKSTFSEYCLLAYQIKGFEAYNTMLANI